MTTLDRGHAGETLAEKYLQKAGLKTLAKNYRAGRYELDLVMYDKRQQTIVFVEVKSRGDNAITLPRRAITAQKKEYLRRAAKAFLNETGRADVICRFDAVEVWPDSGRVNWMEHAW